MIRLELNNIEGIKKAHAKAVVDYVKTCLAVAERDDLYNNITQLPCMEGYVKKDDGDYSWLEGFILADINILKSWVVECPQKLKFKTFMKLYNNKFAKGADQYVDSRKTYNAHVMLRMMGVSVCPYCEDNYIGIVELGGRNKRLMEFDHFYPKADDKYPALAMCFYNLIPSCMECNKAKLDNPLTANPYNPNIERLTKLAADIPVGVNYESVSPCDCKIVFHARGDMIDNVANLALEQRYAYHQEEAHQLLSKKQKYSDEKIEELARLGFGTEDSLRLDLFGKPRSEAKGKELRTKLKEDLIGY